MDAKTLYILFLLLTPVVIETWQTIDRRSPRELRSEIHYHSKRHMLPRDIERKRRTTTQRVKELRKKPSGHLKPLREDELENDEVVSVAIGPPAIRTKYEKVFKQPMVIKSSNHTRVAPATNLVKDILVQLGREFLTHKVSEDFVFGQYVGNAMKNLTSELRLHMQHDILDLIMKYQRISRNEIPKQEQEVEQRSTKPYEEKHTTANFKEIKAEKKSNDTDEGWPDFSNLAKIVG